MADRTLVRLYDSYETAAGTVRELERAGLAGEDISIISNNTGNRAGNEIKHGSDTVPGAEIGAGVGAFAGGAGGMLAGLGLLAIPGVGPVVAAGWLAALAVGAAGGAAAGGIIGGLIGAGIKNDHAEIFAEGVRRGGTLVSVRASGDLVGAAEEILDRHAVDPEVRRAQYAASGWSAYNPDGPLLTEADIDRARRSTSL